MKKLFALGAMALAVLTLTACGKKAPKPTEAPTIPIMMVESKPTEAPTEETRPPKVVKPMETRPTEAPTEPKPTEPKPTEPKPTEPKPTEPPKPPVITKHPTGEKVKPGEGTWFIAHADGDEGIRWWFNPPEGGRGKSPREIMELMPELKVELLPDDTIGVSNIPEALDGWLIQAEFYNNIGNSWSNGAKVTIDLSLTDEEIQKAYQPVLDNFIYIQHYDGDADQLDKLKDPFELYGSRELMEGTLGYALKDLDGNGIPELIVGNPGYENVVAGLFTLENKTPVKIFAGRARNRYYLYSDNKILQEGSNGASSSVASVYSLERSRLRMEESVWSVDADGSQKFYYSGSGKAEEIPENEITGQKYEETTQRLSGGKKSLPELKGLS